ncbi:carboxylesterase family protein [Eubacteriaceae bacterium ES3]|nr:carboxylesterase family protein [Eubacteriaceae bacterium ES3]
MGIKRRNVASYKGIPYAQPPVLERRFKAPEPHPPWQELRPCFEAGNSSIQMGGITIDSPSSYRMDGKSEDCLYLNIWTPAQSETDQLPVYVFIHGGAFATGSGSEIMYDGHLLSQQGIIVVTINYRLGALGFLATHGLYEESGFAGNYGILDQIQALKWVQENISSFGGDPQKVTVGGQSAGAYSVTALLLSKAATGLFHQAIVESGSIFSISAFARLNRGNLKKSLDNGTLLLKTLGIQDNINDLPALRKVPDDLLAACSMVKSDQSTAPSAFSFWPVFDGCVLPENPVETLRQGNVNKVKLLIGYNTDESSLFIKSHTNAGIYKMLCYQIFGPEKAKAVLDYFSIDDNNTPLDRTKEIYTYSAFLIGMTMLSKKYSELGQSVYFYNFDYDPTILKFLGLNSAHGMELPFVFGNGISQRRTSRISNLSWIMQNSWVNFIKNGNPNFSNDYKGKVTWPAFNFKNPEIMIFDKKTKIAELPNQKDLEFLENIMF